MLGNNSIWHKAWGLFLLSLLFGPTALAGMITGELDKVEGTLDDTFIYTLTIEGSYQQEPSFPVIDGIQVRRGGTTSTVQMINGRMSRFFQVTYHLIPERTGRFEVPALVMTIDGKQQSTLPLEFEVKESLSNQADSRQDLPFYVERLISTDKLYLGEPLLVTDRVYTKVRLLEADLSRDNLPVEFRQLEAMDERRYQRHIDGALYTVIEFQTLLMPSKAGEFTIPALVLNAGYPDPQQNPRRRPSMFDDLMGRTRLVKRRARSDEHQLTVQALPANGRSSQYSGLVGRFELETQLGQRSVQSGDNINLTLRVFGEGLTEGMSPPELNMHPSIRVYDEQPIANDQVQGQKVLGERIFQYTLVPTQTGTIQLGSISVQFFNPETGRYEWLKEDLGEVEVRPRPGQEQTPAAQDPLLSADQPPRAEMERRDVAILEQDIHGLHEVSRLKAQHTMSVFDWSVVSGIGLSGMLFALVGWLKRFHEDTAGIREQRLKQSRAARHFSNAVKSIPAGSPAAEAASALVRAFRTYMRDKSQQLRFANASQKEMLSFLQELGIAEAQLELLAALLKETDQLIYSASSQASQSVESLKKRFLDTIEGLEKTWPRGK